MSDDAASCLAWPNGGGLDERPPNPATARSTPPPPYGAAFGRPSRALGLARERAGDALDHSRPPLEAYAHARAEALCYASARVAPLGCGHVAGASVPAAVRSGAVTLGDVSAVGESAGAVMRAVGPAADAHADCGTLGRSCRRAPGARDAGALPPAGLPRQPAVGAGGTASGAIDAPAAGFESLGQMMGFAPTTTPRACCPHCDANA